MKDLILVLIATSLALLLGEVSLRVLPVMDLRFQLWYSTNKFSYLYHHKPPSFEDFRHIHPNNRMCEDPSRTLRILFLGDSWMEGDGIPLGVADYLKSDSKFRDCIEMINGGATSFSPSLYLLAGEYLVAQYHPHFVIINVDETDLMDESLRYRLTTLRDEDGNLERVVPNMTDLLWNYGHVSLAQQPSYLLRLIEYVYFTQMFLPRLRKIYLGYEDRPGYNQIMAPQLSKQPRASHKEELEYFEKTVDEMLDRLVKATGSSNRILLTRHPHFMHLTIPPGYNNSVSEILADKAVKHKVPYYDAEPEIKTIYGDNYPMFFGWPKDPFSHLTDQGYRRYGFHIGKVLLPLLAQSR